MKLINIVKWLVRSVLGLVVQTGETGLQGKLDILVLASPDRVYNLISDIARMGEWSPECRRCEWLDKVTTPAVGARFKGHNRRGWLRWTTTCRLIAAEPGLVFAFEVVWPGIGVQSRWRYELEAAEGGTILTESFDVLWYTRVVTRLFFGGTRSRLAQIEEGVGRTLEGIKAAAEAQ